MATDISMADRLSSRSEDEEEEEEEEEGSESEFQGFGVDNDEEEEEIDEKEDEDVETETSDDDEKDAIELDLERRVFGDSVGFRDAIKDFHTDAMSEEGESSNTGDNKNETALSLLQDSDLFFVDSGPGDASLASGMKHSSAADHSVHHTEEMEKPAWEDSDDERRVVSLMDAPMLRKLRQFEGEDEISGKEYIRRLRKQFELLHPRPEWANWDPDRKRPRRRRRRHHGRAGSIDGSASSAASDESMSDLSESDSEMSTQPLAKLLRSTEPLTRRDRESSKRVKLRSEVIAIERMKDIGPTQPHAITSISIHPTLPLILSSGISSTLFLHYLHPRPIPPDAANPLITSLHLKHTPLSTTAFSAAPSKSKDEAQPKIYMSSRRRYFHVWDLPSGEIQKITRIYGHQDSQQSTEILKPSPCGRFIALQGSSRKGGGVINILSASTLQWTTQVRADGHKGLADFAWWSDGRGMTIIGRGGEAVEWSESERRIIARWQDEGAVGVTVLRLGGSSSGNATSSRNGINTQQAQTGVDRYVAVGSSSGIVNLYERSHCISTPNPTPVKVIENLTTSITHLAFSPCGQLLALASRFKRDALRLLHVPTRSVYKNWPTSKTPLGRVSALAIGEYDDSDIADGSVATAAAAAAATGRRSSIVLCTGNEAGVLRAWEVFG